MLSFRSLVSKVLILSIIFPAFLVTIEIVRSRPVIVKSSLYSHLNVSAVFIVMLRLFLLLKCFCDLRHGLFQVETLCVNCDVCLFFI